MYNWIKAEDINFDSLALWDRWMIEMVLEHYIDQPIFQDHFAIAMNNNPTVFNCWCQKSPKNLELLSSLLKGVDVSLDGRTSENELIKLLETTVIYTFPEMMTQCDYIVDWDKRYLHELVDLKDKLVLDIGSGTGRLTFAAAEKAKKVYSLEPTSMLRNYLNDYIESHNIENVIVADGFIANLPFEDNTFDVVMSGHVVGDALDDEIKELTRVVKSGGWIIDCIGEDNRSRNLNEDLVNYGFEVFYHKSISGGNIYNYRKQVLK